MSGKIIGYIRVSTYEQNGDRQLDGLKTDRTYTDKASGRDTNRPELVALLDYVRDGDTVKVYSMDRLARNLDDLRKIVKTLTQKGSRIEFIKESLVFTGEDSPMATLLLSVMGAFVEFERSLIRERQREGVAIAKAKGLYRGRKPKLNATQIEEAKAKIAMGVPKAKVARELSITRMTLYSSIGK
jgi:DNA invertase Pin-like site-specific DNA recombinase